MKITGVGALETFELRPSSKWLSPSTQTYHTTKTLIHALLDTDMCDSVRSFIVFCKTYIRASVRDGSRDIKLRPQVQNSILNSLRSEQCPIDIFARRLLSAPPFAHA